MGGTFQISSFLVESLWALQCLQNTLLLSVSFSSLENNLRQSCWEPSKPLQKNSKAIQICWMPFKKINQISTRFRWTCAQRLTCREHLLVEARGSDRYIKVSNVRDLRWQVRHCTVDLNWPWNSATMMDSFNSLCLLQATSAAVWSSRWSFSSSLCCFRFSTCQQRDKNVIYNHIVVKSQRMLARKK